MQFVPKNVLVTGGAGFIGTNFVRHFLHQPGLGNLIVLDALTYAGRAENLAGLESDPRYRLIKGDICDQGMVANILTEFRIDTIVNFAAETHVDRSILGPDEFIRTNVLGTHALLRAAKEEWTGRGKEKPHRFHQVSTDEVYGSLAPRAPPFHEGTPYAPNSPYSASKAAADHLVRAYHSTYGLQTTVTNCSNNYGPYHFPEKLIPLVIVHGLIGREIPIYGDGLQIRDWLHVSDHCAAISLAIAIGRPGETYNVGGGCETTNIDIVKAMCRLIDQCFESNPKLGISFPNCPCVRGRSTAELITHVVDRLGHDRRYSIDFSKATRDLGYMPTRDLSYGLPSTLKWYIDNPRWWDSLRQFSYGPAAHSDDAVKVSVDKARG